MRIGNWNFGFHRYGNCWTVWPSISRYSNVTFYTWWRFFAAVSFCLAMFAPVAHAGHCRHLFVQHHAPVVAVVQPYVTYSVGDDIRLNALAQKIVDRAAPQIAAAVAQQLRAPEQGSLALKSPTLLMQKCGRCHAQGKNELAFDGNAVTLGQVYRFDEIFGKGRNVPDEMKALVASIKPEEIGQLKEELMDLPIAESVQPYPAPPRPSQALPPLPGLEATKE